MLIPSAGHRSRPTARTVSNNAASSPGWPAAAIQLADSFTRAMAPMRAAARFVSASPTAIRPDAGASMTASGARSPIAIASPRTVSKPIAVTATSATGTCQRPTIWSRAVIPPTERSPMVTRKALFATAGKRRTRSRDSRTSSRDASNGAALPSMRCTSRRVRGGLPSNTSRSMSTGRLANRGSSTIKRSRVVA